MGSSQPTMWSCGRRALGDGGRSAEPRQEAAVHTAFIRHASADALEMLMPQNLLIYCNHAP